MRKEATLEQWRALYTITSKIKELEPWNYLWDSNLIVLELPDEKEPIYISIMGRAGNCYGIGTYVGYNGYQDYCSIMSAEQIGPSVEYVMFEQSNLSCYFGNREEVPSKAKKVIKDLELKFRGKNQWTYFESYKKGYTPYILDQEETILLTKCYEQLLPALQDYLQQDAIVDFEIGEMLTRKYNKKKKTWSTYADLIDVPLRSYPAIQLSDDIIIAKMKKKPQVNRYLALDMVYLNASVADKKYDRPVNPKMILLMDEKQGVIIDNDMLDPYADEIQAIIGSLGNFVLNYGRPKTIFVRNIFIESVISDTCSQLKIKVKHVKTIKVIDEFVRELKSHSMNY